jgi:hypothetical protein
VTLDLLGVHTSFRDAFLMDYANRAVTVAFKFVPLRLGVDEWASGAMAAMLGNGGAAGVTVAVVRKARLLCWSLAGLAVGARRMTTSAAPRRAVSIPVEPANNAAS